MSKKINTLLAATLAMAGGLPEIKINAKMKRSMSRKMVSIPPRSMTLEESAYYKKHKKMPPQNEQTN